MPAQTPAPVTAPDYSKYARSDQEDKILLPYVQWCNKELPGLLVTCEQADKANFVPGSKDGWVLKNDLLLGQSLLDVYYCKQPPRMVVINTYARYLVMRDTGKLSSSSFEEYDRNLHQYRVSYLVAILGSDEGGHPKILHDVPFIFTPKGVVGARFGTVFLPAFRQAISKYTGTKTPMFLFQLPITEIVREQVKQRGTDKSSFIWDMRYHVPSVEQELHNLFVGDDCAETLVMWYETYPPKKPQNNGGSPAEYQGEDF